MDWIVEFLMTFLPSFLPRAWAHFLPFFREYHLLILFAVLCRRDADSIRIQRVLARDESFYLELSTWQSLDALLLSVNQQGFHGFLVPSLKTTKTSYTLVKWEVNSGDVQINCKSCFFQVAQTMIYFFSEALSLQQIYYFLPMKLFPIYLMGFK